MPETAAPIPVKTLPLLSRLEEFLAKSVMGHFFLFQAGFSHSRVGVLADSDFYPVQSPEHLLQTFCVLGHSPSLDFYFFFCSVGYFCLIIVFDLCQ